MQRPAPQNEGRNVRPRGNDVPFEHNVNIPVAPRNRSRAVVQLDHEYSNGRLSYVTLRPVRQAGRDQTNIDIFGHFAARLRTEIYRDLRPTGLADRTIRNRVRISIFMNNWVNPGNQARRQNILVRDLNDDLLSDMFEDALANGSQPDLDIYDLLWKVWINPASIEVGGSREKEDKQPGLYSFVAELKTVKGIDKETIGCAAIVLGVGYEKKEKALGSHYTRQPGFTKTLHELQNELDFYDPLDVTVYELENFVKVRPNYRVVVIVSVEIQATIYTGTQN